MPFEKLCDLVESAFKNVIKKILDPEEGPNDPTLVAAYSVFNHTNIDETLEVLHRVSIVKSIQNAVGSLHQKVLGNVDGWQDSGQRGGGYDIRSKGPIAAANNRVVLMEVKMRWNTIKASGEKKVHDDLSDAVKHNWGGEHPTVGYIAQIVPKNRDAHDKPWKVSKREADENDRVVDGKTAYHLVTGHSDALESLLAVLPHAFNKVLIKRLPNYTSRSNIIDMRRLQDCIKIALPTSSAYVEAS